MNILVVGGPPTHGVPERERFDVRLTQYLANRAEAPVVLHLAVPGSLAEAVFALRQPFVNLGHFDLIVLQAGAPEGAAPPRPKRWQAPLRHLKQLRQALTLLAPYRSRVVVLTPPPVAAPLPGLLRRWECRRIEALCRLWAFRVVNRCQPDLRYDFLFADESLRLNRLGHHYLSLEIIRELRWPSPKDDGEPAWL